MIWNSYEFNELVLGVNNPPIVNITSTKNFLNFFIQLYPSFGKLFRSEIYTISSNQLELSLLADWQIAKPINDEFDNFMT